MTKTEFFDLMIANRNYINRDSVVTVNSRNTVYVKSVGIANTGISSHKSEAAALVACEKYSRWFAEWLHVEALAINDAYNTLYIYAPGGAAREVWENLTAVERAVSVECAHKEAIRENKSHDNSIAYFAAKGSKICLEAFTESQIKQMAEYCHAEALMMVQDSRLIDCLFNPALVEADHAEALEQNAAFDRIAASMAIDPHGIEWAVTDDSFYDALRAKAVSIAHAEALEMNAALNEERRIAEVTRAEFYLHNAVVQRDHFIPKAHAEALAMDATYSAIIADRNATLELSGALGRDMLQKSIVMLKCQTVGEVSGEVEEGDTVTVILQDQNGNKITVTGEVEEILE